jgi:hypothetical protein
MYVFFAALMLTVAINGFSQDRPAAEAPPEAVSVPEAIRRPTGGEAPRPPRDVYIGELGRGGMPADCYRAATRALSALLEQKTEQTYYPGLAKGVQEATLDKLKEISARKYRIGGGREEPDGSYSYLFRYLGSPGNAAGEIYLRKSENSWLIDDIYIVDTDEKNPSGGDAPYGIAPYERFY